jgi:hypothetical protein
VLQAPVFVIDLIKEYRLYRHKSELLDHLQTLLTDLSVIFTQSKHILKDHRFLLGKQPMLQDHPKMGKIQVFIRVSAILANSAGLELILAYIFVFIFLPFNAARDASAFSTQKEVFFCMNRREELLKALKEITKHINNAKLVSEIVICLELCELVPCLKHAQLILEICKEITVIDINDLIKLEQLILKIQKNVPELQHECLEAWAWAAIKYSDVIVSEVENEHLNIKTFKSSVLRFFKHSIEYDLNLTTRSLELLWEIGEIHDFQVSVCCTVLLDMLKKKKYEQVLQFISTKSSHLKYFYIILQNISAEIIIFNANSNKIIGFLVKMHPGSNIFTYFLPDILRIFQLRKPDLTPEELTFLTETVKILMTVFIKSPDKKKVATGVIPLLLTIYHRSYPIQVIKSVSKALVYINSTCQESFKQFLNTLQEPEKKFVESQLVSSTTSAATSLAQPTITLQLKFKKP